MKLLDTISAACLDLKCYAGNVLGGPGGMTITINDQTGNPVNPPGPVRMEVRQNAQSPLLLVFADNDGLSLSGNVITLLKQVDLKGGEYQYDICNVNDDGSLITYLYGKFIVVQNITLPRG